MLTLYYLCQDLHDHTQSPLASHGLDDSFLKSPTSEVVMRKANIRKSNTVAYRGDKDRPNKWKRASINGHIYNFDVSELYKITKKFQRTIVNIFLPIILTYVLGTQTNCLIETVLLSTHYICFG